MSAALPSLGASSMTGFGVGHGSAAGVEARCELRSVNHRGFEVRLRLPTGVATLQAEISALLRTALGRGHVDVSVEFARGDDAPPSVRVDASLAAAFRSAVDALALALTPAGEPPPRPAPDALLALALAQPGMIVVAPPEQDHVATGAAVLAAVQEACSALIACRQREGARLCADLGDRLQAIEALRASIAAETAQAPAAHMTRLRERLAALLPPTMALDGGRLETEIALLVDRSDVTEELVRLAGHLHAAGAALRGDEAGRTLGFLVQEMLREANTIGSKAVELDVVRRVLAIKVELERVREQAQNLA